MRLIDADALTEKHCDGCAKDIQDICKIDPVCASMMWIVEEHTVDAVEVVRCKDCKYWSDGVAGCTDHVKMCKIGFYMVGENGYCVYGERKNNEID